MLDLSFDEAKSVISDKTNPHHARYHNNDPDIHGAVSRAYLKQYPDEYDLSDKTPEAFRNAAPEKAGDPQPGSDPADAGEDPERTDAEKALIEHWGSEAQANVQVVSEWARSTIGEAGLETLHQKYPGLLNDVGIIKALHAALSR